jgi:hypothetical protein
MFTAWGDNLDASQFVATHRLPWTTRFYNLGSTYDDERHNFLSHCPVGYPSLITADQIAAVESFLVDHTVVLTELDALGVRMRIAIKTKMLIDIGNPQSAYRNILFGTTFLRALSPFFPEICFETYVDAVNFNAWPEDVQRQNPIG